MVDIMVNIEYLKMMENVVFAMNILALNVIIKMERKMIIFVLNARTNIISQMKDAINAIINIMILLEVNVQIIIVLVAVIIKIIIVIVIVIMY